MLPPGSPRSSDVPPCRSIHYGVVGGRRRSEARAAGGVGPDSTKWSWSGVRAADAGETRLASRLDRVPPSHVDWMRGLRANGFVVEALHELYAPEDAQAHEHYDIATAQWARQRPSGGPRGRALQPLTTGRWCSWLWERARWVWISMILTKEIHDQLVGPASDPARGEPRRGFLCQGSTSTTSPIGAGAT